MSGLRPVFILALAAFGLLACAPGAPPGGGPPPSPAPDAGPAPPPPLPAPAAPDAKPAPPVVDAASPADLPPPVPDTRPAQPAPAPAACKVDPMRIFADVRHLASPELRGRKPGDPGNELSVKFAEQQFAAAGLAPAGEGGSYRQPFEFRAGATAHNVVGVLKGADPVLGKEVVIIGAHIDHLGVNRDGAINHGADDNASGAALVMELARLFRLCNLTPRRTMLFIEFNAEEMGLIGSRAYVQEPLYPLASTLAVYNFDMVGAGDGSGALIFGGNDARNRWMTDLLRATTAAAKLPHVIQVVPQKLASDHAPFVEKGVPSLFAFSRPDPHFGYHTPDDDIDNVNLPSLQALGELFWPTVRALALGEEGPMMRFLADAPPATEAAAPMHACGMGSRPD